MERSVRKNTYFVLGVLFLLIGVMPFISSEITQIKIKTVPDYNVQVSISKAGVSDFVLIDSATSKADEYGDVSFEFPIEFPTYNLYIFIKKDGETLIKNKTYGLISGENVDWILTPSWFEPLITPSEISLEELNKTEQNENSLIETTEETNNSDLNESDSLNFITGKVVSLIKNNKTLIVYIFLGALVLAGAIFSFMRFKKTHKNNGEIKVKKLSDLKKEKEDSEEESSEIEKLQIQIAEAQKAINKLKNKEKIKEAERKLEQDKEELEKLKEGED
jgi:hypothetical protein